MIFYVLMTAIILCMIMSVRTMFLSSTYKKRLSLETFAWATNLYTTILIGFAMIYLLFELRNHMVILDGGNRVTGDFFQQMETSFYFSAMTMFSVGYGDISPIGIGRMIATIQAFIGYTLPVAFVIRTVIDYEEKSRKNR